MSFTTEPSEQCTVFSGTFEVSAWAAIGLHMHGKYLPFSQLEYLYLWSLEDPWWLQNRSTNISHSLTQKCLWDLNRHSLHGLEVSATCNHSMCRIQMSIHVLYSSNAKTWVTWKNTEELVCRALYVNIVYLWRCVPLQIPLLRILAWISWTGDSPSLC